MTGIVVPSRDVARRDDVGNTFEKGEMVSQVATFFGPDARVRSSDFQVAGFEPFSTVDWPDKL
ncbi:MAG TPA: hypothetical protein VFD20_05375, partial [Demequina sp.]|nr:hypothetical protein [Demequina sp.]